jgi:hypothetical protein
LFHYIPREQARSEGPRSHQKEIDNLLARRRAFRRGVELDRTFGLDNYDIYARQYFSMAPMWDKPDSKAEDYYPISPYAYCGGDPVNNGDGHEFGHLIGLKDRYAKLSDEERKLGIEPPPDPGWEDTMMGSKSGFGTTKNPNMQLKSVLDYVINAYSFLYGWMPYYSSLLYNPMPGIRVGTGYFHE